MFELLFKIQRWNQLAEMLLLKKLIINKMFKLIFEQIKYFVTYLFHFLSTSNKRSYYVKCKK